MNFRRGMLSMIYNSALSFMATSRRSSIWFNHSVRLSSSSIDRNHRSSVFIAALKTGTTENMISEYFSQFGDIESIFLSKSFLGVSRNYGFVNFTSQCAAKKVLSMVHKLQGKTIDVRQCKTHRVVHVGNIPSHFAESALEEHFSKFGKVESVKFIHDSKFTLQASSALITFSSIEEAANAVIEESHDIEGSIVKVKLQETTDDLVKAESTKSKKLKVESLPYENTTVEKLWDYFKAFGTLKSIDVLLNEKNRTCTAIVLFHNLRSIEKLLAEERIIDGCALRLVRIPNDYQRNSRERSLFLENLAPSTTAQSLVDYFSLYGYVYKAVVLIDQETGLSRQCGVVKFKYEISLRSLNDITQHNIDGFTVKARRRGLKFHSKGNRSDFDL